MVAPPQFWILDASNRLCILSDAFLIDVFPLSSVVFARPCCGEPLLGVVLAVARDSVLLLFHPAMHASQGIIRVFFRVLLVGLVFWAGCSKRSFKYLIDLYNKEHKEQDKEKESH